MSDVLFFPGSIGVSAILAVPEAISTSELTDLLSAPDTDHLPETDFEIIENSFEVLTVNQGKAFVIKLVIHCIEFSISLVT